MRESGKGIYRKMGLRGTFSRKEPFQDQVSVSQFSDGSSATGFGWWLRLDRLTQDGEPDLQALSPFLWPSSPQLHTAGSLIENRKRNQPANVTFKEVRLICLAGWSFLGAGGAFSAGEEQHKGVRGHSLAASTSRPGVKGGWLERALPQAGQG